MNKSGPVIIIEDDEDDQLLFELVFRKLAYPNKVLFFDDGQLALNFLMNTQELPFLILSDINMPRLNGFELRRKLHEDAQLQVKCIPYLFFTTSAGQQAVIDAYSLSVQGFFIKPSSVDGLLESISVIMEYWKKCAAPNQYVR